MIRSFRVRSFALITQSFLNSKEFSESFVHRCCSIFNEPSAAPFGDSLIILPQTGAFVNPFSKLFSKFFLRSRPGEVLPLPDSSRILSRRGGFVKAYFRFFSISTIRSEIPARFPRSFVSFALFRPAPCGLPHFRFFSISPCLFLRFIL